MKLIHYIALSCFLLLSLQSFSSERKKVLVLHSYHQSLQWTANVNSGIQNILDSLGSKFELDYEYLDTKRNPSLEYLNKIIELYDLKLQKENYDAIIVSDNNALSFVKDHRHTILSLVGSGHLGRLFFPQPVQQWFRAQIFVDTEFAGP